MGSVPSPSRMKVSGWLRGRTETSLVGRPGHPGPSVLPVPQIRLGVKGLFSARCTRLYVEPPDINLIG